MIHFLEHSNRFFRVSYFWSFYRPDEIRFIKSLSVKHALGRSSAIIVIITRNNGCGIITGIRSGATSGSTWVDETYVATCN